MLLLDLFIPSPATAPSLLNSNMLQQLALNNTGNYEIPIGIQFWLPVQFGTREALVATVAHNSWARNQSWSIRFWFSREPNGPSITSWPNPNLADVSAVRSPTRFGLYDFEAPKPNLSGVQWLWPATKNTTFYLNIQNRETRANAFLLTLEHMSF
jgi:hypothetical protein